MFKVGEKVCHFMQMNKIGTIIEIQEIKNNSWFVGGTSDSRFILIVKYPDNSVHRMNLEDARKVY